jgi:chorismate lyase / 3-hydroxybenzoate synthase
LFDFSTSGKVQTSLGSYMVNTALPALSASSVPAWVDDLLKNDRTLRMVLSTETIRSAEQLSDHDLQNHVRFAYEKILAGVTALHHHPVRFWNNVPRLTSPASAQRNRYMVFNAGRYEALAAYYGEPSRFDTHMPAATAVGADTEDLKIVCLSADEPALSLNNPRQVAPYHYSRRFGPLPPCFARAVRLASPANWLIVGGTAAIRGEDSVYREDLARQINETLANLAALICAGRGEIYATDANRHECLRAYRELRVYFPNAEHEGIIRPVIQAAFPNVRRLEMVIADLCRPELLVEIEGVAELSE